MSVETDRDRFNPVVDYALFHDDDRNLKKGSGFVLVQPNANRLNVIPTRSF